MALPRVDRTLSAPLPVASAKVVWRLPFDAVRTASGRVLVGGAALTAICIVLATFDVAGLGLLWTSIHWTLAPATGSLAVVLSVPGTTGNVRDVRKGVAYWAALWTAGQLVWDGQVVFGFAQSPTPGDLILLASVVPMGLVLRAAIRGYVTWIEEVAVYLDAATVSLAIGALALVAFGWATSSPVIGDIPSFLGLPQGLALVGLPMIFFAALGANVICNLALNQRLILRGTWALTTSVAILATASLGWLQMVGNGGSPGTSPFDALFSVGLLLGGYGASTWVVEPETRPRAVRFNRLAGAALPVVAGALAAGLIVFHVLLVARSLEQPFLVLAGLAIVSALLRQTILLHDLTRMQREKGRLVADLEERIAETGRVQAQVVASSKRAAVGELSAAVAHEVNNPLQGILGYAELLLREAPEDGSPREELEVIRSEALRARSIVQSLMDFARPRPPDRRPTDLAALVSGTIDLMRYHLERGGVTIEERYADLPLIELDPDAVRQAVLNVVNNAAQAVPADGGRLTIETQRVGRDARITIADSGTGMDAETLERAFVPFFTTRDTHVGTGLGLSVSQGIVEAHGGRIRLLSEPGRGTTVLITLPLDPATLRDRPAIGETA